MRLCMLHATRGVFFALSMGALVFGLAAADPSCRAVAGTFVTDLYVGEECPTVVPQCFHAMLHGDIEAPAWSVIGGATPAPTASDPTRTLFDMSHTVFMDDGTIVTADELYVTIRPVGPSPFTSTIHLVTGSGAYEEVGGELRTVGWFDFAAGHGEGAYEGTLCA